MAVHARELINKITIHDTLAQAVSNCSLVIGTSARTKGQKSSSVSLYSPSFKALSNTIFTSHTALVLGSEETGLTKNELKICDLLIHIPAESTQPSMNLSHAASAIFSYIYSLKQDFIKNPPPDCGPKRASKKETLLLIDTLESMLNTLGFINPQNPETGLAKVRQIIFKAGLGSAHTAMLTGIARKIDNKIKN
jgi:TrmH family RNA methyltransferase